MEEKEEQDDYKPKLRTDNEEKKKIDLARKMRMKVRERKMCLQDQKWEIEKEWKEFRAKRKERCSLNSTKFKLLFIYY